MKRKPGFWILAAIAITVSVAMSSRNMPAAICIGPGTALLLAVVTNLEVDHKKRK
jgi:hypothetical protein